MQRFQLVSGTLQPSRSLFSPPGAGFTRANVFPPELSLSGSPMPVRLAKGRIDTELSLNQLKPAYKLGYRLAASVVLGLSMTTGILLA